jgi:ATP-binding cassette subfamily F protein 3
VSDGDAAVDKTDRKAQRQAAAALRQQLAPLKKAADKLEAELGRLQERLATLEARLGDSGLYDASRKEELRQALADQATAKTREAELEEQWLEALERLEGLQAELEGA